MKTIETALRQSVPMARSRRKPPTLWPKAKLAMVAKKKALRPKPDSGNAVAVPRLSGQLKVASIWSAPWSRYLQRDSSEPVLIAAENAVQEPMPVKKEHKLSTPTLIEPGPCSYAGRGVNASVLDRSFRAADQSGLESIRKQAKWLRPARPIEGLDCQPRSRRECPSRTCPYCPRRR